VPIKRLVEDCRTSVLTTQQNPSVRPRSAAVPRAGLLGAIAVSVLQILAPLLEQG
jgi:hypothetical protein